MTESHTCCDEFSLKAMLREELHANESDKVLAHVEDCIQCQQRVAELAASTDEWNRLPRLMDDSFASGESFNAPDFADLGLRPIHWNEEMSKQLLSPATHPEMLGSLGRYDVERLIGAGGMGVVFKAYDQELNRPVAIKLLAPYLASSVPARKRFFREARAAAAIVHQHVVPIHNVETERDSPFIVMQYVSGESLQMRIDRNGPLELCEILRIGMQVADGLSAAHQQGLVHRDIKPSNILLEEDVDRALISDFGLARAADDATLTRSGFHPGTPQYMSPEQASGQCVDPRSDLFSLGSTLYTMCTGCAPFRAESSLGVMRRIAESDPTPIQDINADIPKWLCTIIGKLMAKDSDLRFQTATEVRELLEKCLSYVQQPSITRLPAIPRAITPPHGSSYLQSSKGVITMVSLVSVLALAGFVLSSGESVADKLAGMKGIDGQFLNMTDEEVRVVVFTVDAKALGGESPAAVCDFGTGRIALLNQEVNRFRGTTHSLRVTIAGEQAKMGMTLSKDKSNAFQFNYKDGVTDCQFIDFKFQYRHGQIVIGDKSYSFDPQESPGTLLIVDRTSSSVIVSRLKPESRRSRLLGIEHTESDRNPDSSKPVTWKDLLGKEPPVGYPTDVLSLIEGLNNSRGEWIFAGKMLSDGKEADFEATMQIQGGFQAKVNEGTFPQWNIAVSWPREKPSRTLVLAVMVLPEPDTVKLMLIPRFAVDGKALPSLHKMYGGVWDSPDSAVKWTPKQFRLPATTSDGAGKDNSASFELAVNVNGELRMSGCQISSSECISGQTAARVGKPFVEEQPRLDKLPNGFKLFFAGRTEVYVVSNSGESVVGPRVDAIGCDGDIIFGRIIKYEHVPENSDKLGYFWLDSSTGKLSKGMELSAWRDALKAMGISTPRMLAPEQVRERY
ncbi:MAG: serine/threonine-protein kinase [Planctomycetaceae bacterium]